MILDKYDTLDKEQIKKNLKTALTLEFFGIHFENMKEVSDEYGIPSKTIYYLSVPETSIIKIENEEFKEKIKTADGLITLAKEEITNMFIDSYKSVFGEDDEFLEDIKNDIPNLIKFYAKVRNGEVWNEELGNTAVKEIIDAFEVVSEYKEV